MPRRMCFARGCISSHPGQAVCTFPRIGIYIISRNCSRSARRSRWRAGDGSGCGSCGLLHLGLKLNRRADEIERAPEVLLPMAPIPEVLGAAVAPPKKSLAHLLAAHD